MNVNERFWSHVREAASGCWEWVGAITSAGYGNFNLDGTFPAAHRVAYELMVGPIPEGLQLDHLCFNRRCVNPAHLDPVTGLVNSRRSAHRQPNAMKTHCKNGHEFTPENTYRDKSKGYATRVCRACNRAAVARLRARKDGAS